MKKSQLVFFLSFLVSGVFCQTETWSLERCVRHAHETSLSIQQANISVKRAYLAEKQAKSNRLPGVDGTLNVSEQLGRTINPLTNTYASQNITSNNLGVTAGLLLFAGGQVKNSVKQAGFDQLAARADAEQIGNNIALQVASAYLNILLTEEQLKNAKKQVAQSQDQMKRTDQLIEVGTLPAVERLTFVAQIARDEQGKVTTQNNLDLAYLNLKQLLQLEPDYNLQIEHPTVPIPADANPGGFMLRAVYNNALNSQPNIKASDYRIESAKTGIKIAEAAYFPRLQAFADLGTRYSSFSVPGFPAESFGRQYETNFGQNFGLSASIPIYQRGQTKIAVQRAELAVQSAQIEATQTRQQLKTDIQTAIANAKAAEKQLEASQRTLDAMRTAFENSQKRYDLGAINSLELTTAQNNRDIAENDLVVSKYDYLFKLKILDFYNGEKIKLD